MKKSLAFLVLSTLMCDIMKAQCPSISGPSVVSLTCSIGPTLVTLTSNYSTNITSRWIGPFGEPIASVGTATSVANIGSSGTYTVEFKDNSSNCVVNHTLQVGGLGFSTIGLTASPSFTQMCTNSLFGIQCTTVITSPVQNVPVNYTWMPGSVTSTPTTFTTNPNLSPMSNICGNWQFFVKDLTNNCLSSMTVNVTCGTFTPSPISIAASAATLCLGSSVTYTASGVNTYTWSNGPTTATMNAIPTTTTTYGVSGTDPNGCISTTSIGISPNPNCALVWPGDANSDGVVNNLDPFEIGLAMNATGPARQNITNAWNAWYCSAWTGSVSTGKNKCHADCNGDGVINNTDNGAITVNFGSTHAFKNSNATSLNADINIVPTQSVGYINEWNTADIFLGNTTSTFAQLYGVAYEIQFDSTFVENSSSMFFNQSFLNDQSQNILFDKLVYADQKNYICNVRINGQNVSGNGKIGEITYKVKASTPENSVLNLNLLNVVIIDNTGARTILSGGSTTLNLIANPIGVNEIAELERSISVYPNPAKDILNINSQMNNTVDYIITDILGKKIESGSFDQKISINTSSFENGTYILKLKNGSNSVHKRLIISK